MGETESTGGRAAIQQDHIHAVGGRWERRSQRVVLQLSNNTTYFLWAGDVKDGVSEWLCSFPAISRTFCGRAMRETESAGCSVATE
jgi:hypothetical protein